MSKVYSLTDEDFTSLVANCFTYTEILIKLGLVPKGGTSSKKLKQRIKELSLSVTHFFQPGQLSPRQRLSDILVENSTYTSIRRLKLRLVKEGLMVYQCTACGNDGKWLDKAITLQLDHINGVNDDHRLENLRFLCPNCHSQTDTYAGKNK